MPPISLKLPRPKKLRVIIRYGTDWRPAASNGWQDSHLNSYGRWARFVLETDTTFEEFLPLVKFYEGGQPASLDSKKGWWGCVLFARERRAQALIEWASLEKRAKAAGKTIQEFVCFPPAPRRQLRVIPTQPQKIKVQLVLGL